MILRKQNNDYKFQIILLCVAHNYLRFFLLLLLLELNLDFSIEGNGDP